jgi:hypothetical protein
MVEPRQEHWIVAKHVLRYLRGTMEYGLRYLGDGEVILRGYSDSDWAGGSVNRKSTTWCCFSLGSSMITWFSRKYTSVAPNLVEVEYMALLVFVAQRYFCIGGAQHAEVTEQMSLSSDLTL